MSGTSNGTSGQDEQPVAPRRPHRVIGTPAQAHVLLAEPAGGEPSRTPAEPAEQIDPAQAKRWERLVAAFFVLSLLASAGFIAAYVTLPLTSVDSVLRSNLALGTAMGVGFLAMGIGFTLWVRLLMPHPEVTEQRDPLTSPVEAQAEFEETFLEGADASGFVKYPLLRRTLIGSSLALGVAPIFLLGDMGPLPKTSLDHTVWRKGMRMAVYGPNTPLLASDFNVPGQMITVIPEGYEQNQEVLAKATTIIIKMAPGELAAPTVMNWTVDNIVAYSKVCTHVGCPVALYEQSTHHILCPCHQSTFDATRGATVLFGPAPRPLPQLPIGVDSQGYLIANGDFAVPVGPSFWELGASGFDKGNE